MRFILALTLVATGLFFQTGLARADTLLIAPNDAAMSQAQTAARSTLTRALLTAMQKNGKLSRSIALKVAIPVGRKANNDTEVIWVENITRTANGFAGKLQNTPVEIRNKRKGSRVRFTNQQIADWALPASDGRLFGHYTTRAMLPHLDAQTRKSIEATLQPHPTPTNW